MRESRASEGRRLGATGAALLVAAALAGCADAFVGMSMPSLPKIDDINPWAEKPQPLPGKRISVIQQENLSSNLAAADKPIMLPAPQQNVSWSQPGGVPSNAPGHLVNGTFSLPQALQAAANTQAFATVSASPLTLSTYAAPVSNDPVTLNFKQSIGSTDALRTGTYAKSVVLTLSTTTP